MNTYLHGKGVIFSREGSVHLAVDLCEWHFHFSKGQCVQVMYCKMKSFIRYDSVHALSCIISRK